MADVKISDLPAATSANGAMQIEVNDGGTSKSLTLDKVGWSLFETVAATSGTSLIVDNIPSCRQIMIELSGVSYTNSLDTLDIGVSIDNGSTKLVSRELTTGGSNNSGVAMVIVGEDNVGIQTWTANAEGDKLSSYIVSDLGGNLNALIFESSNGGTFTSGTITVWIH